VGLEATEEVYVEIAEEACLKYTAALKVAHLNSKTNPVEVLPYEFIVVVEL
jgi:hypothetical protein